MPVGPKDEQAGHQANKHQSVQQMPRHADILSAGSVARINGVMFYEEHCDVFLKYLGVGWFDTMEVRT